MSSQVSTSSHWKSDYSLINKDTEAKLQSDIPPRHTESGGEHMLKLSRFGKVRRYRSTVTTDGSERR